MWNIKWWTSRWILVQILIDMTIFSLSVFSETYLENSKVKSVPVMYIDAHKTIHWPSFHWSLPVLHILLPWSPPYGCHLVISVSTVQATSVLTSVFLWPDIHMLTTKQYQIHIFFLILGSDKSLKFEYHKSCVKNQYASIMFTS